MFVPTNQMCNLDGLEHSFFSIPKSKTKHVDDVNFHYFTISFNGLFEYFDMSIRINVFDIN